MEKQKAACLGTLGIFYCLWRSDLDWMNRNVNKEDSESREGRSSSREEVGESLPSERLQQEWNARAGCVGRTASPSSVRFPPPLSVVLWPNSNGHVVVLSLESVKFERWPQASRVPFHLNKNVSIHLMPHDPSGLVYPLKRSSDSAPQGPHSSIFLLRFYSKVVV